MKTVSLIGLMVLIGGIGGAGYAEYDRVTTNERTAKEHVFQITRVFIRDRETAESAAALGVRNCVRELHFMDFPPVLASFLKDNAVVDYEVVRKHGSNAAQQKTEIEDKRNALSAKYYDPISDELDTLPEAELKRVLKIMRDYNRNRKDMSRCIHRYAYKTLNAEGAIEG